MEIQLMQLYLLVSHIYDIQSETCFQRLSNNAKPSFTCLLTLDLANTLEQIPRLDLDPEIIKGGLAMHQKASRFLPDIAAAELDEALVSYEKAVK